MKSGLIGLTIGLTIGAAIPFSGMTQQTPTPAGRGMRFTEPSPLDFNDHEGYVPLFDGRSLTAWDGNPKFWRVEDGAIVGESTASNPSGNSYIVHRNLEAKDFTLKFEIKIEGDGGSGIQYRSRTAIPWLAPISPGVASRSRRRRRSSSATCG